MSDKQNVIAAIDVGTNSFHLAIASVDSRGILNILEKDKEVVRLGASSRDMKYLQNDGMERGIAALKNFAEIARAETDEIRAVATSAVREAENRYLFMKKVFETSGINIEVISGNEEGRLIYLGAIHALPIINKTALIIDIGGGSTESVIGKHGEVLFVNSAKLGAIRMTKRFFDKDIITEQDVEDCRNYIRGEWAPIMQKITKTGFDTVVGTSGTIQNLAVMALAARGQEIPDVINGLHVSADEIRQVIDRLISARSVEERRQIPGLDQTRADIIVGGALIFENALNQLKIDKVYISSYALREGIIFDTFHKKEKHLRQGELCNLRYRSVQSLMQHFSIDMPHANHVSRTALTLFDELQGLHRLSFRERELLEAASLLHDVGYHISHDQHHKHSYYIIKNSIMPGFTMHEADLIANIARYHRKSHPKQKHENFAKLSPQQQNIVCLLAGMLRIAEGVDRRSNQNIEYITVRTDSRGFIIELIPQNEADDPDIELWGAERRKKLLKAALGCSIKLMLKK